MKLLCTSPAAFNIVREEIAPLPSESAIYEKFKGLKLKPGINKPGLEFLIQLKPKMNPGEEIVTVMIDEMKIEEVVKMDYKIDAALGPHKYANQILIKSITGDWEVPVYTKFDSAITKKNLFKVIRQLEAVGIKPMFVVCDQGPRNLTLAKKLGIDVDSVSFQNPCDPSRKIFFAFDVVHGFKNLR